jgi:tetratricopeptide (TPR) repeat protein
MIYGAQVREDVYLITQNALADNTYMNVMRDLYGDRIWIPSMADSSMAFKQYVDEVQAGKRPPNPGLVVENGRVHVTGVSGVMEINGIICQMIFDHNQFRHDFYVEESYVIPWMYPYLTPHGLILKLNRTPTPLDPRTVRNDRDFWDWYTRRLVDSVKFRRDVVARKSFSKLRSAIAGLYRSRMMPDLAEEAFLQARLLYPLSPEAVFRLAQEVWLQQGRFVEARRLLSEFCDLDPGNKQSKAFLARIDDLERSNAEIRQIQEKASNRTLSFEDSMKIASLYLRSEQQGQFMAVMQSVLQNPDLTAQRLYQCAQLLFTGQRIPEMNQALQRCMEKLTPQDPPSILLSIVEVFRRTRQVQPMLTAMQMYLKQQPDDWKMWIDLAIIQDAMGKRTEAARALSTALRKGGREADTIARSDPRLSRLLTPQTSAGSQPPLAIPGLMGP